MTPPPPFDPEPAAALAANGWLLPPAAMTLADIPARRQAVSGMVSPSSEELARDGAFTAEGVTVPGPPGDPEVPLLICRPATGAAPMPVIYHVHGGGMVLGDNRLGIEKVLDWAHPAVEGSGSSQGPLAPVSADNRREGQGSVRHR